jgi:hypothetical protein
MVQVIMLSLVGFMVEEAHGLRVAEACPLLAEEEHAQLD